MIAGGCFCAFGLVGILYVGEKALFKGLGAVCKRFGVDLVKFEVLVGFGLETCDLEASFNLARLAAWVREVGFNILA